MNEPSLIPIDGAGDIRRTIPPRAEREALGKEMRQRVPRSVHGTLACGAATGRIRWT